MRAKNFMIFRHFVPKEIHGIFVLKFKNYIQNLTTLISFLCLFVAPSNALTSFDLHNINAAHAQGYTGKGVNLGIIDGGFDTTHPLLQGNILDVLNNGTRADYLSHGTHVAGIILANKTNNSSYGIATEAKFLGYGNIGNGGNFHRMLNYNVKIINNSHTGNFGAIQNLARNNDILVIYASGNSYTLSPHSAAQRGTGSATNLGAWLVVGNVDSNAISKNANAELIVSASAVSNNGGQLCVGASAYCVMAAGTGIYSLNNGGGFAWKTGTSMAAPAVSGMAALVAERFPFLGGKQLADVILSTANNDFKSPKVVIKGAYVIYIDNAVPTKDGKNDEEQIRKDLTESYNATIGQQSNLNNVISLNKEEVFGQGIVDVAAALRGLKFIDINRLSITDKKNLTNKEYAFYTIDTKGYDGLFENDISQRKWDKKYQNTTIQNQIGTQMANLDAGLLKKGAGTLSLSGHLLYLGATVVQEGELRFIDGTRTTLSENSIRTSLLSENLTKSSTALLSHGTPLSVKGEVLVGQGGTLSVYTDTNIAKSLENQGVLNVGLSSPSLLSVGESYTQKAGATLRLGFLVDTATNSALKATSYNIENNTTLIYKPMSASVANRRVDFELQGLENQLNKFTQISVDNSGYALKYTLLNDKKSVIISAVGDIYADFDGANESLATVLRQMSNAQLSSEYTNFFAKLNSQDFESYKETLQSLDDTNHLRQQELLLLNQNKNILQTVLNLQEIDNTTTKKTKNNKTSRQRESIDYFLKPSYTSLSGANLRVNRFGMQLYANKATYFGGISGFLGYDNFTGDDDSGSHSFSLGLGVKNPLTTRNKNSAEFFGGASVGGATSWVQKDQQSFDFNTFILSAYAGLDKNYYINGVNATPTAFLSYNLMLNSSIKDKGFEFNGSKLFAKSIEPTNSHFLSANLGVNLRQNLNKTLNANAYGFYERRILGNELESEGEFEDYLLKFTQKRALSTDLVRFGASLNYEMKKSRKIVEHIKKKTYKSKILVANKKLQATKKKRVTVVSEQIIAKQSFKVERIYFISFGLEGEMSLNEDKYKGFGVNLKGGVRF